MQKYYIFLYLICFLIGYIIYLLIMKLDYLRIGAPPLPPRGTPTWFKKYTGSNVLEDIQVYVNRGRVVGTNLIPDIAIQMISEICACPDSIDKDNGIATMLADLYDRVSRSRCIKYHAHGRYEALAIMFRLPTCVTNIEEN